MAELNNILIIGGTSGIGEGFARHFHKQGKKVIVAGRRKERLDALANELSGIDTLAMDITKLDAIPQTVDDVLKKFPSLDTVILCAGVQRSFSLFDPKSTTDQAIVNEITANFTAPVLLCRAFLPHLSSVAASGKSANLLVLSSAIAYVPLGFYPVYCPTKAAVHAFCITAREQLGFAPAQVQQNLSIAEVVPPYVDTALDAGHRDAVIDMLGGPEKAFPPMPLAEYLEKVFKQLEKRDSQGKLLKEVGVGFGEINANMWRDSFGKTLESMGIQA